MDQNKIEKGNITTPKKLDNGTQCQQIMMSLPFF